MKLKFAFIFLICLLIGLSGCRPGGDNPGDNLKTESDSLKAHILNDNLIIIDTNHELAIKSLKYRQSMVSKLAIQKKTTNFLMLVIGLIVALLTLFMIQHKKRMNYANMSLVRRTMEIINDESVINEFYPAPFQNKDNVDLVCKLDRLIRSEKSYRDPGLTLAILAGKLGTDTSYLSEVFNERYKNGFNDYINDLRVKEACRLLMATNDKNTTIDHILSNSGFSSRTPFYNAFKKFTGVTPEVFKRMIQSQN